MFTRRVTKSCAKVGGDGDGEQVENMSLKSIHSKYTKLKRQVSESLWSIPTSKMVGNSGASNHKSPTKIL